MKTTLPLTLQLTQPTETHDLRNEVEAEFFVNVLGKVAHPGRLLS